MKYRFLLFSIVAFLLTNFSLQAQIVISGVIDGPLSGGVPKAIELYVYEDIADLSIYGVGGANNGEGSDGQEFTFPAVSISTGNFIYIASESTGFTSFFGFAPDYTSSAASINGDDAIELFKDGTVIDIFGDINVDGTGTGWDYEDGWAYRNNSTGPDGNLFILSNWTYSGKNALDGETTNSSATNPFPIGSFNFGGPIEIPSPPVANSASNINYNSFASNWNSSSGATKYYLDVSELNDFSTFVSGYSNLDVGISTSYSVTGLNASTPYYYRVRAGNSEGISGNSNIINVTTTDVPSTTVYFKNPSASVLETEGNYNLDIAISNPDPLIATTADIVLTVGDNSDIDSYTTQKVTFPAGNSSDQIVALTITDDQVEEGNETLTFEIQSVNGGNGAVLGSPSQFNLTILESFSGDYYDPITPDASGAQLRFELHNLIKNHIEFPYTSSGTDVWDILMESDEDPSNSNNVILIYTGRSQDKDDNASNNSDGDAWNREHVWAKSRGDFGTDPAAGTDAHHLKPADASVNTDRSNKDFDDGGIQHSEAIECLYDGDSWEPRDDVKGDVARMLFYMDVRYEGERGDPELHLVDYTATSTGEPLIGKLSTLLEWHNEDPPDIFEMNRNDVIYGYQQNRNPFIDHPEWVDSIWGEGSQNSPQIVSVERNIKVPDSDQDLNITANVTDNGSIVSVTLKYQVNDGLEQSVVMSLSGSDLYTGTIPALYYEDADILNYYVIAEDDEGNLTYGYLSELFTGITPISSVHSYKSDGLLLNKGMYAKVRGTATVASGIFSQTSLDIYLQDATGGVNIYKGGGIISIIEGNQYTVCGIIDQYNGKTEIVPDEPAIDVVNEGSLELPIPIVLTIDQLLQNPEGYEGMLVKIEQTSKSSTSPAWPSGISENYLISDDGEINSLILRIDEDTDLDDNEEPSWPQDVVGIFSQYDTYSPYFHDYQIQPRKYTDISSSVGIQLTILLEGPYDSSNDVMFNSISNDVPLTSPYSEDPRSILEIPNDIVDWVMVELRETENGPVIHSKSALLHKDGRIVADDGVNGTIRLSADAGNYYIVVKHRNHLTIMSNIAVNLSN